jgi:polyisoprenoid-binding protein YceI
MKKASGILLALASLFVMNLQRPPVADMAKATTAQTIETANKGKKLKVNTTASSLAWVGTKPSGKHNGTIGISEGSLSVKKNQIIGGTFTLDMATIADKDMEGKGKEGLEGHLKSPDFFDVAKFPTASFEIASVSPIGDQKTLLEGATHQIVGNLTMKGITKSVTIPAVLAVTKSAVSATSNFNIDRTDWGINYGTDGKVAKEINLSLNLVAAK